MLFKISSFVCPGLPNENYAEELFSTSMPQEFLTRAVADYLVGDTDLFSLSLSNREMTTAKKTIAIWCE